MRTIRPTKNNNLFRAIQYFDLNISNTINESSCFVIFYDISPVLGALLPCPDCQEEKLTYSTKGFYNCQGSLSEWSKCIYTTKEPKRRKFKLPGEVTDIPAM